MINFEKMEGLIPAVIQDSRTKDVLMLGFMNQEAYEKTIETSLVTFYSRTRKRLWTKGEESGNFLKVVSLVPDCDEDTLLIMAEPAGPVCHTGEATCFGPGSSKKENFLGYLGQLVHERKMKMPENSYTTRLFSAGLNKIAQKVGEEAVELIIEAKDDNRELFLNEAADLIYHLIVLLEAKDCSLGEVEAVLHSRHSAN